MHLIDGQMLDGLSAEALQEVERQAEAFGGESQDYWLFHRQRFTWTFRLLTSLVSPPGEGLRILDVGNGFQTLLLARLFPAAQIDTLGYLDQRYLPGGASRHWAYDLSRAYDRQTWPQPEAPYDLILFLEVIEHLQVAPSHVLDLLAGCLVESGRLLLSTPNAVRLPNRLSVLKGQNPYELIRPEHHRDPGHVREYTRDELFQYARQAGLATEQVYLESLSGARIKGRYRWLLRWWPTLRNDLVLVLCKS